MVSTIESTNSTIIQSEVGAVEADSDMEAEVDVGTEAEVAILVATRCIQVKAAETATANEEEAASPATTDDSAHSPQDSNNHSISQRTSSTD